MEVADDLLEDSTKQCVKVLEGHKKAVREIAYAPN
jgi:WD40 repeat protein